jgi:ParB family transcriptional regulator, chromosome partitioning protein
MATAKNKSKATRTRKSATTKRARGKLAPGTSARGLDAADVVIAMDSAEIADVVALIRNAGGALIGAYRDPLGGRPLVLASLPLSAVQPTPFQRDLSPTHAKRLAVKIDETAAFLDPLIVVRGEDGRLWTPNGRHRR